MVNPIQPGYPAGEAQSPQERRQIFELQWEMSLISCYLSASQKNGHLGAQASKLKNDLMSGRAPNLVANELNFFIDTINQTIEPGKAPLPKFFFSDSETTKVQAMKAITMTVEKILLALKENHGLDSKTELHFWDQTQNLLSSISSRTNPDTFFSNIQSLIDQVNKYLPMQLQLPKIPDALKTRLI